MDSSLLVQLTLYRLRLWVILEEADLCTKKLGKAVSSTIFM